jgi:hypothetical protein
MKLNLILIQLIPLLIISTVMGGCARRDPEAERQQAFNQTLDKMQSCAPGRNEEDIIKIAITGVTTNPNETAVRIVAYTLEEGIDFDLPVYWMSRGRWLINEQARAYLLDERCREYKLKDRRSSTKEALPPDGRIRLNRGQAFEAILSFPRLPDQTQIGMLVYGDRTIPFWVVNKQQSQ